MKGFFKKSVTAALAASLVFGGVSYPTAEAIGLGDLAGGLLKAVLGSAEDVNIANQRMLENFYYSVALIQAADQNVKIATDDSIANKDLITQDQAVKSAVKTNDAGINMKNGAEQNKNSAEQTKKYLSEMLASGDEEKLKQIDSFIKTANQQRTLSDFMAGVASVQAGMIVATQVKGIAGGNLEGIGNIIVVAKEVQEMLSVRKQYSNSLKEATAEYRKARGIKDPSKKEQKAAAAEIEKG